MVDDETGKQASQNSDLASRLWSESDWEGLRIDRYQIENLLGGGGMGRVFLARDIILQRNVALKVIEQVIDDAKKTGYFEQFLREAQAVAKLEHPNIVRVYDVVHSEGVVAIAMEYVRGGTLTDLIRAEEEISIPEACRIISEAADGLHYAHENNLIHRDVKPANLMLNDKMQCKVVDFGATHDKDKQEISLYKGKIVGSPHFISPEVVKGREPTPQSDIYSLGIVLWCTLVKEPPFTAKKRRDIYKKHLESKVPNILKLREEIPEGIKKLIDRCLKKEAEERVESCAEISETLRSISSDYVRQQGSEIAKMQAAIDESTTTIGKPYKLKTRMGKRKTGRKSIRRHPRGTKSHFGKHTPVHKTRTDEYAILSRRRKKRAMTVALISGIVFFLVILIILVAVFASGGKDGKKEAPPAPEAVPYKGSAIIDNYE